MRAPLGGSPCICLHAFIRDFECSVWKIDLKCNSWATPSIIKHSNLASWHTARWLALRACVAIEYLRHQEHHTCSASRSDWKLLMTCICMLPKSIGECVIVCRFNDGLIQSTLHFDFAMVGFRTVLWKAQSFLQGFSWCSSCQRQDADGDIAEEFFDDKSVPSINPKVSASSSSKTSAARIFCLILVLAWRTCIASGSCQDHCECCMFQQRLKVLDQHIKCLQCEKHLWFPMQSIANTLVSKNILPILSSCDAHDMIHAWCKYSSLVVTQNSL